MSYEKQQFLKYWTEKRKMGQKAYLLRSMVIYGLFMGITLTIFMGLIDFGFSQEMLKDVLSVKTLFRIAYWLVAGMAFGAFEWWANEKRMKEPL
jgi:ABC-type lipoprotein release transport system permease subunit